MDTQAECVKHDKVIWTCSCGNKNISGNTVTSRKCSCGRWMEWSYPDGDA